MCLDITSVGFWCIRTFRTVTSGVTWTANISGTRLCTRVIPCSVSDNITCELKSVMTGYHNPETNPSLCFKIAYDYETTTNYILLLTLIAVEHSQLN